MSKKNIRHLLNVLRPFMSTEMMHHCRDLSDITPVYLEVPVRNGYRITLSLGQLRQLWREYQLLQTV